MSEHEATIATTFPNLVRWTRLTAAVVVSGVLAALTWLFILQEGHTGSIFGRSWSEHDFPEGLGHALNVGDPSHTGLYVTLALGVVVAIVFALVARWLPGRGIVKGITFAPVLFLAWGLVFAPLVDSREVLQDAEFVYLPTGLFGIDAGAGTILSGVAASLIAGVILARVYQLARDGEWWKEHPAVGHGLVDEETSAALLELAEQRPEQRVEGAR